VLNTARRQQAGTFGQTQQMDAIFDLEKQIVFSIFNTVGVTLTAAEREKINENRTGNLLAFLSYGRGLESLDRGNYQEASAFFRQSSQLDPNFAPAQTHESEAKDLQEAEQQTTGDVAQGVTGTATGVGETSLINSIVNEVSPSPVTETTQTTPETQGTSQTQNQTGNIQTSQGNSGGITQAAKATVIIRICNPGKPCS